MTRNQLITTLEQLAEGKINTGQALVAIDEYVKCYNSAQEKKSIDERKTAFVNQLKPFVPKYGKEMLNDFYAYWIEHNPNGKKMRFEMEKVFNIERRLITWHKRQTARR